MGIVVKWGAVIAVTMCFVALSSRVQAQNDYCSICPNRSHTLCKYQGNGPNCTQVLASGVNNTHITTILAEHNRYRNTVAAGLEQRGNPGPQPSAANMKKLVWDNEVAAVAQRWADQCTFAHDACKKVERFLVGQNVALNYPTPAGPNWTAIVQRWYDEVKFYDSRTVGKVVFTLQTGHYTQLVWADTNYIGCGYKAYKNSTGHALELYVCDYAPAGNYPGQPIYKTGRGCSSCSNGCDASYTSLCA